MALKEPHDWCYWTNWNCLLCLPTCHQNGSHQLDPAQPVCLSQCSAAIDALALSVCLSSFQVHTWFSLATVPLNSQHMPLPQLPSLSSPSTLPGTPSRCSHALSPCLNPTLPISWVYFRTSSSVSSSHLPLAETTLQYFQPVHAH